MTIRFTCAECASELKIKDELAGTAGRCPKCKTKFVVPGPLLESDVADSHDAEGDNGDGGSSHDDTALKHGDVLHSIPVIHPDKNQNDFVPMGFNPAETLRLDDSNDDLDAVPGGLSDSEQEISVTHPEPQLASQNGSTSAEEEDLDCPPMMVAHPMLATKSLLTANPTAHHETQSVSFEKSGTSSKSSRPAAENIPFDPLKFLMSDRPVSNQDSLPLSTDRPESVRHEPNRHESSRHEPSRRETDHRDEVPDFSLPDEDSDLRDRPSPRPLNRPTPAAKGSPRPQPEKIDLATAAKMMKKAIRDNQAEEAHQREIDAKAGFDYGQIFREIGLKGLGILAGAILISAGLYFLADRMFSNPLKLPKMGYVKGVIKLDGKPLAGAMINFAPLEVDMPGSKRERIRTSVGISDEAGNFRMMYMPADKIEGVVVGRCRVWVDHIGPKGRSDVPPEWGEGAMVVREVTPGNQKEPFDINLESRTR